MIQNVWDVSENYFGSEYSYFYLFYYVVFILLISYNWLVNYIKKLGL